MFHRANISRLCFGEFLAIRIFSREMDQIELLRDVTMLYHQELTDII